MIDFCIAKYFPKYKSTIIYFFFAAKSRSNSSRNQSNVKLPCKMLLHIRTFCFDQSMHKFKQTLEKEEKEQRINSSS